MKLIFDGRCPKLDKVPSKDPSRPVLTHWFLNTELGRIEATNSYMLATHPVRIEEGDVGGVIPGAAVAAWAKAHKRGATPSLVCLPDTVRLEDGDYGQASVWNRTDVGTFPNIAQLIPGEESMSDFGFGINAKLLYELAQGLGDDVVELRFVRHGGEVGGEGTEGTGYFVGELRPIKVSAPKNRGAEGLIMPIRRNHAI